MVVSPKRCMPITALASSLPGKRPAQPGLPADRHGWGTPFCHAGQWLTMSLISRLPTRNRFSVAGPKPPEPPLVDAISDAYADCPG